MMMSPGFPAAQEAEAGGSLGLRSLEPAWAAVRPCFCVIVLQSQTVTGFFFILHSSSCNNYNIKVNSSSLKRKSLNRKVFVVALGFEFRALGLLVRQSTWSHSTSPCFVLSIFKIGSPKLFAQGWLQTMILLLSATWVARTIFLRIHEDWVWIRWLLCGWSYLENVSFFFFFLR
jgi:hypothetical protein